MTKLLGNAFITLALGAPFFMLANIVGGVLIADFKEEWDPKVLRASLIKYAGLLLMAGLLYVGGLLADKGIQEALGVNLHLTDVITVGIATFGLTYAGQAVVKFNQLAGVKIKEEQK